MTSSENETVVYSIGALGNPADQQQIEQSQYVAGLIGSAQQGDSEALATLWEQYAPTASSNARRIVGFETAPDVVQDVAERFVSKIHTFEARSQDHVDREFGAWIGTTAKRRALDHARRAGRITITPVDPQDGDHAYLLESARYTPPYFAGSTIESTEVIDHALSLIPPQYSAAIRGVDVEGMSYREFADEANIPYGTVQSRLHRGRGMLAKLILSGDVDLG